MYIFVMSHIYTGIYIKKCIGGIMVSVLALCAVDCEFEPNQSYEIGICCFSAKHAALRRKNKD